MVSPESIESTVSSKINWVSSEWTPVSSFIPSLTVLLCSASILTTSSNSASKIWVDESQPLTVPSCVVRVFPDANVPVTSFTTKCALEKIFGGLDSEYFSPPSTISTESIAPISLVVASNLALDPFTEVTVIVGKSV